MKHIFIYNPAAGRDNGALISALREKLQQDYRDLDYEFYTTKEEKDAGKYVKARCEAEPQTAFRFYACGGDGTANEVLHGVVGHKNASMTCFACGSGNDYVKYYGGKDAFLDVDALIAAKETPVDIMKIDDRYALNVTHFGFDTKVAKTMIKVKRKPIIGGRNAYTTGVIAAVFTGMRNRCSVSVDGEPINEDGNILLCTVANGQYVGGSFKCAPRSENDDGLLEICLVRPVSRLTFVRLVKYYSRGEHLDDPRFKSFVTYRRGKKVHVEAPQGFAFSIDGEIVEKNSFDIEILPHAVNFAVPQKAVSPAEVPS